MKIPQYPLIRSPVLCGVVSVVLSILDGPREHRRPQSMRADSIRLYQLFAAVGITASSLKLSRTIETGFTVMSVTQQPRSRIL